MTAVILVIHMLIAVALVVTVLLQRSDGGALGGLGGGSFGGIMSGRQSANLLTRTTGILAACFMGTSMLLAIMASGTSEPTSILDAGEQPATESTLPPLPTPDEGPIVPADE
jgi:preprotein translocase subunit SecG|tara:strand:+ start:607 stop:942 length:336 start_codon:yes stop_codon:yes gene_type:complete